MLQNPVLFMKLNKVFTIHLRVNPITLRLGSFFLFFRIMPLTRSTASVCRKRTLEESSDQCDDCSHIKMIANLKREILELNKLIDMDREARTEALHERDIGPLKWEGNNITSKGDITMVDTTSKPTSIKAEMDRLSDTHNQTLYELELCKNELEDTREALREVSAEGETLRATLSEIRTTPDVTNIKETAGETNKTEDVHPHLDWVGRHYLAVSIPDDRMFKPGQSVTPVGVLQKLFEMRVSDKLATGFSVLLENINIMLSHLEPEWYAKHFGFCRPYVHGNKYIATDRVDTEEFAWMLFEYRAHAPLIEVLAALQNFQNSTGKSGVTNASLHISRTVYSSFVALFRDTVSRAHKTFMHVRERALTTRKSQGLVYVPLTAGLCVDQNESQETSNSVKTRVLQSVLEGIDSPPHINLDLARADVSHKDPLGLQHSLSAFKKRRGLEGHGKNRRDSGMVRESLPYKIATASVDTTAATLERRVLFERPWSNAQPAL